MGKPGSTSWLTAVKKVFRSPTKTSPKKNCKRRDEHAQEDDEDRKKTEKKRWIFRKLSSNNNHQYEVVNIISSKVKEADIISMDMQRSAIAAAEASTAAAKAAVATAQAAVRVQEIIPAYLAREYYAALIIQTSFRGYLARRALRALKGIVKLQALVRGHNMRKQAKATLKCMQSLISVQAKLCDQSFSRPLSHGLTRNSMYAESSNLWDKYKDIQRRKSLSRDENSIEDQRNVNSCNYTIEDIEAIIQSKKEASLCREQALAYALSEQIRIFDRKRCLEEDEEEEKQDCQWLSQWLDSREYNENKSRLTTTTNRKEAIKNIDTESIHPQHLRTPNSLQRSQHRQDSPNRRHSLHFARSLSNAQPMTPPPRDTRPLQAHSASPQRVRSHSAATTPSLRTGGSRHSRISPTTNTAATTPSYMAATESAKARARTQSTPRQRHSTSDSRERGGSVRKRLSYPIPEPLYSGRVYNEYSCYSQNLRSPSFRSVQEGLYHIERGTTCSSYTDVTGGDVSPASTSHLRRWLS